jgi:uncharacterized protein with von Willebrand factor type A (vWA) domain
MTALPRAVEPLIGFAQFLREHGFTIVQEQIVTFLAAIELLGPSGMDSIRRAAHATLAPPPDRRGEFDALFHAYFHEEAHALAIAKSMAGEDAPAKDGGSGMDDPAEATKSNQSGEAATANEILSIRKFDEQGEIGPLRRLRREAQRCLPRRLSFRRAPAKAGAIDLRRSLRSVVRNDGDVIRLARANRICVQRQVLTLIDVSGSMKRHTEAYLRFAHALTQAANRVETFTFGTRLTRITRALGRRDAELALAEAAASVEDWDGGTRIGAALETFLSRPRFANYARGAVVLVLSDGLERGDHSRMTEAVRKLGQRASHLVWLTPLAEDPRFRPETAAIKAILPFVDEIGSGGSVASLVERVLGTGRAA